MKNPASFQIVTTIMQPIRAVLGLPNHVVTEPNPKTGR